MVDIETGKVVDLIESRESEEVEKWLKKFKNIKVVSRDGASAYKIAVDSVFPGAIQVLDRFHVLKNLIDYGKSYLKRLLKNKVELDTTISIRPPKINLTKLEKHQIDLRNKKWELIQQIKKAYEECFNVLKVSKDFGLDPKTVKKYTTFKEAPIHAAQGIEKGSKLDKYRELIIKMNNDKKVFRIIYDEIKKRGYNGSGSLLRIYISKLKKNNNTIINKETVSRNALISVLHKGLDKVKTVKKQAFDKFSKRYPEAFKIFEIVESFRKILSDKDVDKLDAWIKKNKTKNIEEIDSFITGIKRDLSALKNAIKYDYSNGLAEGSINKIKVIKRVMYGRCGFPLLRQKVLLS